MGPTHLRHAWLSRFRRLRSGVDGWQIWSLPRWLRWFVIGIVALDLAFLGYAVPHTTLRAHDLLLFALLLGCTAASVELSRKAGEKGGVIKDVQGVWQLPIAVLLPPLFTLIAPISRIVLMQLRVRHAPLYRRVFSFASLGLSYGAASVTYHGLANVLLPRIGSAGAAHDLTWIVLVAVSGLVQSVASKAIVMTAVKGTDPSVQVRQEVFNREPLYNDVAELCIGILVSYGVAGNPFLAPAALPIVILLQRSLRHAQLLSDSRADSKTGLLNAATWEREAAAEIARAVRAKTPAAVALLDLDHFKLLNDTYGHLVGDQVLKDVARTLTAVLREYDLAGRFGGEEFALLLPHTRSTDAFRIAERLRAAVASLRIIAPGATGGERVSVTVSIGVAALDSGDRREFRELFATADAALYRAKSLGRDQVQMISTTRGLSAVGGPGSLRNEMPIAFRRAVNSLRSE
jgi:diguanylate cyclase (GGDEF)-like protein